MQDIERFTKQNIEKIVVPGFEAEPGEKAEPLAMGRQTIWGGLGKPPSRDVMQAAAKNARAEMMQRMRDNKARPGGAAATTRGGGAGRSRPPRPSGRRIRPWPRPSRSEPGPRAGSRRPLEHRRGPGSCASGACGHPASRARAA